MHTRSGDFASALAIIKRAKSQTSVGEDDVMGMTALGPSRHFKNLPVARIAYDAVQRLGSPEQRASGYTMTAGIQQERVEKGLTKERSAAMVSMSNGQMRVFHVREIPLELFRLQEWSLWLEILYTHFLGYAPHYRTFGRLHGTW
jgi:hypothetical protein